MTAERNVLPEAWVWTNLSELIEELESGSRPKGGVRGIRQGVPSVGGEHLSKSGGFDFSAVRFVPEAFAASMNKGLIRPHDILIVKDGATTGKTSFVDDKFPYSKAVLNEHVFRLRAVSEVVDQRYLFRFLWAEPGQRMIAKAFRGTAQGGINQSFPQFVDVPLAPLREQRRIVGKIEALFEQNRTACGALDRIPPLLKKFRQSVLAAAFRGDLSRDWREQNPDIEPASALLERIRGARRRKWEEDLLAKGKDPRKAKYQEPLLGETDGLSRLPDGWIWTTMDAVTYRVTSGSRAWKTRCGKGTGTFILAQNIRPGLLDLSHRTRVDAPDDMEAFRTRVEVGDILVTIVGNTGDTCMATEDPGEAYVCQSVALLRPVESLTCRWLGLYLQSGQGGRRQFREFQYGMGRAHLGLLHLRQTVVPIASLSEQCRVMEKIYELFAQADAIESAVRAARRRADKLEQSILARAFRGELVPQDPNEEPASATLERSRSGMARSATNQGGKGRLRGQA